MASLVFVERCMGARGKEAEVFGGHGESGDQSEMRGARARLNCVPKMGREMYTKGGSQNQARAREMQTFEDYLEQSSRSGVLPSLGHERTPHRQEKHARYMVGHTQAETRYDECRHDILEEVYDLCTNPSDLLSVRGGLGTSSFGARERRICVVAGPSPGSHTTARTCDAFRVAATIHCMGTKA